ncbi:MAG TPA: Txe/YoeB family addiction module toxin [Chitinophagales bacterium]|nr:Txe/YoeB family addiction module toxin [Chitinophagales bacterium]
MARSVVFTPIAFEQYNEWALTDKATFQKLIELIKLSAREPFTGISKPEPLKFEFKGYWSRRITQEHALFIK